MTQFFIDSFNYFFEFFIFVLIGALLVEGLSQLIYFIKSQ